MEDRARIVRYQEVPSDELNAIQAFTQSATDRIVRELLFDHAGYTGLKTTKSDDYDVTVAKGRLWRDGGSYPNRQSKTLSADSLAPSAGRRIVLLVAFAQEHEDEPQPVKILVNVDPREVVIRMSDTRVQRDAALELVPGVASGAPARPATPPGGLVIASFLLGPGGIVGEVAMETANEAPTLEAVELALGLVQRLNRRFGNQLESLATTVAGVSKQLRAKADKSEVRETQRAVLELREATDVPDTASSFGSDQFTDAAEVDLALSTSIVEGGYLKFGKAARESKLATLANPIDPRLDKSASNLILPKSTDVVRIEVDEQEGELAIASYAVAQYVLKQKKRTRSYLYYAERAPYAEIEAKLQRAGKVRLLDPRTDAHVTIDLTEADWELVPRKVKARPGKGPYWRVDVSRPTWSVGESEVTIGGARITQTFLCAQSGWHKRLDLLFTDADAAGDVHVAICAVDEDGRPSLRDVLARSTIPAAQIKTAPDWTPVLFDPVFLTRGERYGIALVTNGDHRVAVSVSNDLTNGTLFVSTDGAYSDGQIEKDLCFRLYGCRFAANRVTVELEDITLAGGIRELAAVFTGHQPAETDLQLQARVQGVWRTLGPDDAAVLAVAPTTVGCRLVFVGTKDIMPGLDLDASRVIASRPLAADVMVSTPFNLPAPLTADTLRLVVRMVGYDPAIHSVAASILHGAGHATETAFTTRVLKPERDGLTVALFTVAGLPNIQNFLVKIARTTTNPGRSFNVLYYLWFKL